MIYTSSLKSKLSGSISFRFISAGSPPTLWWLFIVWEWFLPLPGGGHDSITSGYRVPWTKNFGFLPSFFSKSTENSSKMWMNSPPIIFRFLSGSVTPLSLSRKRYVASIQFTGKWRSFSNMTITRSLSLYLTKPN